MEEKKYFIRYVSKDNTYGEDLAILTKAGVFDYGCFGMQGYEHVEDKDVALFTVDVANLMVMAFADLFIHNDALSEDELSCHHIDTIGDTWDLYREFTDRHREHEALMRGLFN